jgi:hypothetical protein
MFRVIIDFAQFALGVVQHNVDSGEQTLFDVGHVQMGAGLGIFNQRRQLLKRFIRAVGMHRRDGTGVAGVDTFDEFPSLVAAQLGQQYPVGLHAQAGG